MAKKIPDTVVNGTKFNTKLAASMTEADYFKEMEHTGWPADALKLVQANAKKTMAALEPSPEVTKPAAPEKGKPNGKE